MSKYAPRLQRPDNVVAGYLVGDKSVKITSATQIGFVDKAPEVFDNVLQPGYGTGSRWAPNVDTPMTSSQVFEFIFADPVRLEAAILYLSSAAFSWGTVQCSVFRNGAYQALDATNALGLANETVIAIDDDKQSGVSKIKFEGVSGTLSKSPWCYAWAFVTLEV